LTLPIMDGYKYISVEIPYIAPKFNLFIETTEWINEIKWSLNSYKSRKTNHHSLKYHRMFKFYENVLANPSKKDTMRILDDGFYFENELKVEPEFIAFNK